MRRTRRQNITYVALLAAAFLFAALASWTGFGNPLNNYAYDAMFRIYRPRPWQPQSAILAIDETSLHAFGGAVGIRQAIAAGLEKVVPAAPKAVAIDVILADRGDPASSDRLARIFARTPNLVLACEVLNGQSWEDPLPEFRRSAASIGHVHAKPDPLDMVTRAISLEEIAARERRWALSLEAFRASRAAQIVEAPGEVQVGDHLIPAPRTSDGRLMRIRYLHPANPAIPRVSVQELLEHPELASRFSGKTVFVGVTALTAGDRRNTPLASDMPGVEIHAEAFETIAQGQFLTAARASMELAFAALLAIAAGLTFAYLPGWQANVMAGLILVAGTVTPYLFFTRGTVFSFVTPVSSAWLSIVMAAGYEHLVVRRALRRAEAERTRYQQSLHFVTHEMRTPLTAIQGSSELIGRYNMTDEKRKQIAQLINSESKRLARMIEMFLNVERLSAGQMELKRETFAVSELMSGCVDRVRPLAERKQIVITLEPTGDDLLSGDRELMEYAFYNLLTNAVKYSPQRTEVTTGAHRRDGHVCIWVRDQGIGMDQKEVRKIFQKFYRTKKAEESGEAGTGIGLSIVDQIVTQHGGTIEVTSRPGEGSCFTLVLPAFVPAAVEQKQ